MGSSSVRERIAIVFMTLSVVATLVLGGALAAQLGHPKDQVVQVGAAAATSPDGVGSGDQSAAPADTGAATGGAATAAGQAANGGTRPGRTSAAGRPPGAKTPAGPPPAAAAP